MDKNIACIILAAGKSTRMKSEIPKVLHPICARPMIEYVLDLVNELKIKKVVAVLGHKHEQVRKFIKPGIQTVIQRRLLGTADAVKQALSSLRNFKGTVLVLYADNPLLKKDTTAKLLKQHIQNNQDATLLTADLEKPAGYGRILRDKYSSICGIIEEKDADDFQRDIKEINTGIICFKKASLESALKKVRPNNRKREYYLTDVIGILYKSGCLVDNVKIGDIQEALGINSRSELALANSIMHKRINDKFMQNGVTIVDPDTAFISYGTKIGQDTVIYPFTVMERDVKIGKRCSIGPFCRLREGTRIENGTKIGNFAEVVRSKIGPNSVSRHVSYLGDSVIGRHVNIGAGTITANFDGKRKNKTIIKDGAFIGSDSVLVAPIKIGKGAVTGAGSVVLKNRNVPDGGIVVGVPARRLKRG
ncbi:MAG: hypothetical protein A3K83_02795 [Omnitrophica WOR_2 bacterium RBG_13_44_8b]|nr:MAG: hypothetical protein A3K83_02795 [Omnitrophica WOR_2 bacterium RBG_13_44_8b]